jgi:hypothetical protein
MWLNVKPLLRNLCNIFWFFRCETKPFFPTMYTHEIKGWIRVLPRIAGVPYIFSTKFKQIIPFCIISWSDSKCFRPSSRWLFCLVVVGADRQGQNTAELYIPLYDDDLCDKSVSCHCGIVALWPLNLDPEIPFCQYLLNECRFRLSINRDDVLGDKCVSHGGIVVMWPLTLAQWPWTWNCLPLCISWMNEDFGLVFAGMMMY